MTATAPITNISSYKFAPLTELKTLREHLLSFCKERSLRGTILLSTEGINMFIAGEDKSVRELIEEIRCIKGLETLEAKFSYSDEQPFRRMLVRIKKEIITFGVEGISPGERTSPKLKAAELKQWLDEGRPITLLDTRNDYEVKLGTFKGAHILPISHFRQFPDAVRALPEEMKQAPIVMFCTGGIRCEKAGPFMEQQGFQNIHQLDGGILRYFEEVGADYYEGECFVFDQRTGVDPALAETESTQCFACQTPLTAEDQADSRYEANVSCPYCYRSTEEQLADALQRRQQRLQEVTQPLPGAAPYQMRRPLHVPADCDGKSVLDTLCTVISHVSRAEWQNIISAGRIRRRADDAILSAEVILRAGEQILHLLPQSAEPEVSAAVKLLHEDQAIIVLEKPAPLPVHAGGRFALNTLGHFLSQAYAPEKPRLAHRLDSDTTGIMVAARTQHFAKKLQPQFATGEVEKVYLLRVHGSPAWDSQQCDASIGMSGHAGIRGVDEEQGEAATTEFTVLRRDAGQTLLQARPITGRTNQIRLHAWHLGHPIVGDPIYLPERKLGSGKGLAPNDPPLCLHAWKLCFRHPLTGERSHWEANRPSWA